MVKSFALFLTALACSRSICTQDSIAFIDSIVPIDSVRAVAVDSIFPLVPDTTVAVLDSISREPEAYYPLEIPPGLLSAPNPGFIDYAWTIVPDYFRECGHGCSWTPPPAFCALSYVDHPWKQKSDSVIMKIEKVDANNLSANKPSERPGPASPPLVHEQTWLQAILPTAPRMKRA